MSSHPAYWVEATGQILSRSRPEFVLVYGLLEILQSSYPWSGLGGLSRFFDPQTNCATLSGEPGWTIYRKPEVGEPRRWALEVNSSDRYHGGPVPVPPAEEGPHPSWPAAARYFAEAMDPNDMGDPAYPEEYFTAAEVHEYIVRLMPVYAKYHPESAAACKRIAALSQAWVDLDASR